MHPNGGSASSDDRLSRLEDVVSRLVGRLDGGDAGIWAAAGNGHRAVDESMSPLQPPPVAVNNDGPQSMIGERSEEIGDSSAAPVFLIRDVASEVGVRQLQPHTTGFSQPDIITRGLISMHDAGSLIELYVFLAYKPRDIVAKCT